jgi:hypothetical protein
VRELGVCEVARYKGINQISGVDRIVVALMIVVPTLLVLWLVWLPAIGSVCFPSPTGMASARSVTPSSWG